MSQRTHDSDATADRTDDYDPNPNERGKWLSALIALLGLWMIVEALVFDLVATQFWNDLLVGALLLALGGYNFYRRADEHMGNVAVAALVALLGLWLIVTPFVFGESGGLTETTNDAAFWNDVIVGLIAAVLGAYSAYEARDRQRTARRTTP